MKLRISALAIRNPIPVAILFIALTLMGLISYGQLPIKQYPNISFPLVAVTVTQSGAAPTEMETQITRPIEDAVAGIAGVKHISSDITLGASTTSIEFELGSDMQKVTDEVRTAIDRTRVLLPPGIDPPNIQRVDIDSAPILTYAVSSNTLSPVDLSWFVDDTVARAIQAGKGVAQVSRLGGIDREINVTLDPAKMAAFAVTAPQVNAALYQFNIDEAGGRANIGAQEQTVRILGQAQTVEALRALVIPAAGRYVTLGDVAEVGDGQAEARGFARLDNRPAVAFQVNKTRDASDVSVEKVVVAAVAKLQAAHPEVKFTLVVSTVAQTRAGFTATIHVLIEGMGLAALVVFLFLRSWRATAIAAIAMPLSLAPTFTAIQLMGFSLNSITLLSLTLVIGILVDDAIVEIENIEKRIERGATPYRAALIGADSIGLFPDALEPRQGAKAAGRRLQGRARLGHGPPVGGGGHRRGDLHRLAYDAGHTARRVPTDRRPWVFLSQCRRAARRNAGADGDRHRGRHPHAAASTGCGEGVRPGRQRFGQRLFRRLRE
jgi:HAE1 family hydrophobic/amphiphilic exporter-1